jgi:hypothetical protein
MRLQPKGDMANLPEYNTTIAPDILTLNTRFKEHLKGVKSHVYFLKANIARMRDFCDHYLNFVSEKPRAPVYFKPFIPFVALGVIDYGSLSVEAQNMGWISQHEVWFALPLEWYSIRNGRPIFQDWVLACPFLFVDNTLSVASAREVQGFSKLMGSFAAAREPRLYSPPEPYQSLNLRIKSAPNKYSTADAQMRTLLEIYREPRGYLNIPPALDDVLGELPKLLARTVGIAASAIDVAAGLPIFGYERLRDLQSLVRMGQKGAGYVASLLPKLLCRQPPLPEEPEAQRARTFWLNLVNMKQFRDAEDPNAACYQAIVNSTMNVERYNGGGLLFEPLSTDPTGGFYIRLRRGLSQPIIESLGLEVSEECTIDGTTVATLRPLLPLWLNGDVGLGTGAALGWRTKNSSWHTARIPGHAIASANQYNTTQGVALAELPGPFIFPKSTFRVLPLMADEAKLKSFCTGYLTNSDYRFEPWGSYVYLIVGNHEDVALQKENLGTLAFREVSFLIPVKWYDRESKLIGVATVAPFGYLDDEVATITAREVYGAAVTEAVIESPPNAWLNDAGPIDTRQSLLKLSTIVLPAMRLGLRAERRELLEIQQAGMLAPDDDLAGQSVAEDWGPQLLADHRKKISASSNSSTDFNNLMALALEPLANGEYLNSIALKQFRDSWEPNEACYQALVLTRRSISHIFDCREIDEQLHVRIARYPTQPIVERLGLRVKWTDSSSDVATVDVLQPIRPFWMKVALNQGPTQNLCWRAETTRWTLEPAPTLYFGRGDDCATRVGEELLDQLSDAPQFAKDLASKVGEWSRAAILADAVAFVEVLAAERLNGLETVSRAIAAAKKEDAGLLLKFLKFFEEEVARGADAAFMDGRLEDAFSSEELARLVELLREAGVHAVGSSKRLSCGDARRTVEKIEPQIAIEGLLSRHVSMDGTKLHSVRAAKIDFPIRVDSINHHFHNRIFRDGEITDDRKYYSEEKNKAAGGNPEGTKRRK